MYIVPSFVFIISQAWYTLSSVKLVQVNSNVDSGSWYTNVRMLSNMESIRSNVWHWKIQPMAISVTTSSRLVAWPILFWRHPRIDNIFHNGDVSWLMVNIDGRIGVLVSVTLVLRSIHREMPSTGRNLYYNWYFKDRHTAWWHGKQHKKIEFKINGGSDIKWD